MFNHLINLIEFVGTLIIGYYCASAVVDLLRYGSIPIAQNIVARGAIAGLTVKTISTFLRFVELRTFDQIAVFAVIFTLRQLLKRQFKLEMGVRSAPGVR